MPDTLFTPPTRRVDAVIRGKKTHWYIDAKGTRLPGVTTLLEKGIPKEKLIGWAASTTAAYAVDHWDDLQKMPVSDRLKELNRARYISSDAAKNRGTEIHALADRLIHGEEVEVPDELAGHVESYVKFLDEWEPQVLTSEFAVAHYSVGYAGTGDFIADMDGQRWLIDIKSGKNVYPETALQLAAYRFAEVILEDNEERPMEPVDRCAVMWVRADGYDIVPVVVDESTFLDFRYVARVARWVMQTADGLVLSPLAPPSMQEALPL